MDTQKLAKLVAEWEASDRFPCPKNGNSLLLLTEHNLTVIGAALHAANVKSVNDIVLVVNQLTLDNKLQYDIPRVVEKIVTKEVIKEVPATKSEAQKAREARERLQRMGIGDRKFQPKTEFDRVTTKPKEQERAINEAAFNAAANESAMVALDHLIANYEVASPSGRVDHGNTHRRREQLRAIQHSQPNGQKDFVRMAQEASNLIRQFENERSGNHNDAW